MGESGFNSFQKEQQLSTVESTEHHLKEIKRHLKHATIAFGKANAVMDHIEMIYMNCRTLREYLRGKDE